MQVLSDKDRFENDTAVTIGVFDGVHYGHQKLLKEVKNSAEISKLKSVVVTFDVHPLSVIAPGHDPKMLTSLDRKLELLKATGLVDAVVVVEFNAVRAAQSAEDFVKELLVEQLRAKEVFVGEDFRFGHQRRGSVGLLERMGRDLGFKTNPIDLELSDGELPVSSTRIRQYLSVGNVEKACELLTRPHQLSGVVVRGDNIGAELGYPTANTDVDDIFSVPSDGVYAGWVTLDDGSKHQSAISIGVRPMFHEDNIRVIEPFLLDFDGDLYGRNLSIEFIARLRDQLVLESTDALVQQMDKDVERTREILSA